MRDIPLGLFRVCAVLALVGCTAVTHQADAGRPSSPPPVKAHAPGPSCPVPAERVRLDGPARQGSALYGHVQAGSDTVDVDGIAIPLAADGTFLIAFDRDAPPTAMLHVTSRVGCGTVERTIAVAPGQWDIQPVNASITGGVTSAEFKRRRGAELDRIAAARAGMTPGSSEGWRQTFVWPVVARISGRFGSQRIYRGTPGSYHGGVDIAAPAGATYVAPADGVVALVADAPYTLEGNLLIIDHGMGLNSAFLHSQRVLVKQGDVVRRGQPIGIVGATGRVTGPHLHWGMKWQDARIDPVTLVKTDESER